MADVKISELTALTSPDGAEELVVNDGGTTKKITITNATSASLARAGGTMTGDTAHGDNVKAKFGAGDDLSIYHDGSNSYIDDGGTGDLYLRGSNAVRITSADGSEKTAVFNVDGAVNIYYDNDKKLATTATGVAVTGGVALGGTGAANTLDDYEEGTWTPADAGGGTLNVTNASYTKIGNVVNLSAYILFTSVGSNTAAIQINGLPFTILQPQVVGSCMSDGIVKASNAFNTAVYISSTTIKFYMSVSGASWEPFRHGNHVSVNDSIYFNATYFTSQ